MFVSFLEDHTPLSFIGTGVVLSLALVAGAPLSAQDTVVEGKAQRSGVIEERIAYNDLDLNNRQNQALLISRIKEAATRVCDIIYYDKYPMAKFQNRCPQNIYMDSRPQIYRAIASAKRGKRVAINLVVAGSN